MSGTEKCKNACSRLDIKRQYFHYSGQGLEQGNHTLTSKPSSCLNKASFSCCWIYWLRNRISRFKSHSMCKVKFQFSFTSGQWHSVQSYISSGNQEQPTHHQSTVSLQENSLSDSPFNTWRVKKVSISKKYLQTEKKQEGGEVPLLFHFWLLRLSTPLWSVNGRRGEVVCSSYALKQIFHLSLIVVLYAFH